jgi:hypothetical protein
MPYTSAREISYAPAASAIDAEARRIKTMMAIRIPCLLREKIVSGSGEAGSDVSGEGPAVVTGNTPKMAEYRTEEPWLSEVSAPQWVKRGVGAKDKPV